MADNYISVVRYDGANTTTPQGEVSLGVNDVDTTKLLESPGIMTEGTILSVHDDVTGAAYQNTSGSTALAVLTIQGNSSGVLTRHVKIYSGPTTDSVTGATLLLEVGAVVTGFLNASDNRFTTPPLKIQNNNFIIVENVDDSRAGINNLIVLGGATAGGIFSIVVERGA